MVKTHNGQNAQWSKRVMVKTRNGQNVQRSKCDLVGGWGWGWAGGMGGRLRIANHAVVGGHGMVCGVNHAVVCGHGMVCS